MKNILSLLALAFSLPGLAQDIEGKNMGKINLSAFAFKGFNLQYERQVGRRITVALGYGMIPKSTIGFKSYIENQIDDPDVQVGDFRLGTSILTPEARYYFGKNGAFHGFYLGPYLRFGSYKIAGPVSYTSSTNSKRSTIFDGKLNTITGGILIGSSWHLSKRFYLDWWILGASYGGANGNLVAVTSLTPSEQESLRNEINDISVAGTEITADVNANGATVKTTGSMVGVRGLGINFGVRF